MTRGRRSAVLSPQDRRRLKQFQAEHGRRIGVSMGLPQLKLAMAAPFSWETLQRAITGKPISADYHEFIVSFLNRYARGQEGLVLDYKSRAAGEREEEAEPVNARRDNSKSFANNESDEFATTDEAASMAEIGHPSGLSTSPRVRYVGRATPRGSR